MNRPDEDCWVPRDEPEDEIGAARGSLHAVCIMILVCCCVYIGIRFFDVDLMHEPPVEIGGVL